MRFFRQIRHFDKSLPQRQPAVQNLTFGDKIQNSRKRLGYAESLYPQKFTASPQKLLERKSFDPFADNKRPVVVGFQAKDLNKIRMANSSELLNLLLQKFNARRVTADGTRKRPKRNHAV